MASGAGSETNPIPRRRNRPRLLAAHHCVMVATMLRAAVLPALVLLLLMCLRPAQAARSGGGAAAAPRQFDKSIIDPEVFYSGSEDVNPRHECAQYHWAHNVHTGGEDNCSAPWKRMERNWSPKDSPVEVSKQLVAGRFAEAEAQFVKALTPSVAMTDDHLVEALKLVQADLVTLFPDRLIDVAAQNNGKSLDVPIMHHVTKVSVDSSTTKGRGLRDFPHLRDLWLELLSHRVSPSIATINAMDNPPFVEILTHSFLDVEVCDALAGSYVLVQPFMRKDKESGVSVVHLLLRDSEADIRDLVMRTRRLISRRDDVRTANQVMHAFADTWETAVDGHAVRGLLGVSPAFAAVVDALLTTRGTVPVLRAEILDVQDELAAHYVDQWLRLPGGFDFGEWAVVTPANHFNVLHLAARQNMPKTVKFLFSVLPEVFQTRQLKELMVRLLSTTEAWMQRTPLAFAAFHHGVNTTLFGLLSSAATKWLPNNNPRSWRDASGKTPQQVATLAAMDGASLFAGAGGGRPASDPYTAAESGGWGVAPPGSTGDTQRCDVHEVRGRLSEARHFSPLLVRPDPSVVRAAVAPAVLSAFSYPAVSSLLRQALQRRAMRPRTDLSDEVRVGSAFAPAEPQDAVAGAITAFLDNDDSGSGNAATAQAAGVLCVRLRETQGLVAGLDALLRRVPGIGPLPSPTTCLGRAGAVSEEVWHATPIADTLAFGQRRWTIYPPAAGTIGPRSAASAGDAASGAGAAGASRVLTQEAGDVVVVPKGWSFVVEHLQAGASSVVALRYSPTTPRVWDENVLSDASLRVGAITQVPNTAGQGPVQAHMDQAHRGWYGANTKAGSLAVIGAGFGRTGTSTMKQVFEELGFGRCYHMLENVNMNHTHLWNSTMQLPQLRRILQEGSYRSGVDYPFCLYYKEWMEMFPEAKIVLTVRSNVSKWWRSTRKTLYKPNSRWFPLMSRVLTAPENDQNQLFMWERQLLWEGLYQGKFLDEELATAVFNSHVREVQEYAAKLGRPVLLYRVDSGEGWKPLCDFLGVPVPSKPFPRANKRDTRAQTAFWLHVAGAIITALLMMAPIAAIYAIKVLLNLSPLPGVVGAAFFYGFVRLVHYWAERTETEVYAISG